MEKLSQENLKSTAKYKLQTTGEILTNSQWGELTNFSFPSCTCRREPVLATIKNVHLKQPYTLWL